MELSFNLKIKHLLLWKIMCFFLNFLTYYLGRC
jgi:hypothetical protein